MSTTETTSQEARPLSLEDRRAFVKLPIEERRRQLQRQAEEILAEYELASNRDEREPWQGGDIVY